VHVFHWRSRQGLLTIVILESITMMVALAWLASREHHYANADRTPCSISIGWYCMVTTRVSSLGTVALLCPTPTSTQ
jgi:lysylphosphatidylglycerol synthetase-like protein (DUF2156 family)